MNGKSSTFNNVFKQMRKDNLRGDGIAGRLNSAAYDRKLYLDIKDFLRSRSTFVQTRDGIITQMLTRSIPEAVSKSVLSIL